MQNLVEEYYLIYTTTSSKRNVLYIYAHQIQGFYLFFIYIIMQLCDQMVINQRSTEELMRLFLEQYKFIVRGLLTPLELSAKITSRISNAL